MTSAEITLGARAATQRSRREQGLPLTITDSTVLRKIATLISEQRQRDEVGHAVVSNDEVAA